MMSPASAHRRAGILLYAAAQFVVLVALGMWQYAGGTWADRSTHGYTFTANFLSDIGATRSWSGESNVVSSVLFGIALGSLGAAVIAFAGAWRAFAFERGRARFAGIAAQVFATTSGAAFVGIAVTPANLALDLHNGFVIAAFGLLLGFAASMTILTWKNGATRTRLATSVAYLVLVAAYAFVVAGAVRPGGSDEHRLAVLVVSQKIVAGASIVYIAYLTLATRRQLSA